MRRTLSILGVVLAVFLLSGCGTWSTAVVPPRGVLFTHYLAPVTTDVSDTSASAKVGTASTMYFQDPILTGMNFAWKDASIQEAAREGGISHIYYADYEVIQILGIFGKFTMRVHGE